MKPKFISALIMLLLLQSISAQDKVSISERDRTRLAVAFSLADRVGDSLWPGWSKAPFAVLLITPDYEFLLRHPG